VDRFVGRAGELALLDAELQAARAGQPRVVLIEGEPGIGKSSLLTQFVLAHEDICLLRASGDEAEMLLGWGLADQLLASVDPAVAAGAWPDPAKRGKDTDPIAVGAQLVAVLGDLQAGDRVVAVVVDDLHWSDQLSARALLFALRRMQADRVLGLISARPGELSRLGEGWSRFASGDHRTTRLRLGGLGADDLVAMARELGMAELPGRAVAQLLDHTGGNAMHCRALLEQLDPDDLVPAGDLPAPRELAGVVLSRLRAVSEPGQRLVTAAAVLGRRCPLAVAAALAGLADPLAALDEAAAAGLLAEDRAGSGATIAFTHPLVHAAVRDDLGSAQRRRLHRAAARLVPAAALSHRVAAAVGPDDTLATDLEEAARKMTGASTVAQAAAWLAQASAASTGRAQQERRLLDALAVLVSSADVPGALALWPKVALLGPSARRSALLGHLDLLCGRGSVVEAHLLEAWQAHNPATEPMVGAAAATSLASYLCSLRRVEEALSWGERAVAASAGDPAAHLQALVVVALSLTLAGRGAEGLARLSGLAAAAAEVPLDLTDGLVMRGMCRLFTDDMTGAMADLSVSLARQRAGVSSRDPGHCAIYLSDAEYRLGAWDDALMHSALAVSFAHDCDRTWAFAFVHGYAALVPAARGDWKLAGAHVEASWAAARAFGTGTGVTTAAMAGAELALAHGDLDGVLAATAAARALGRVEICGVADWRPLEAEALIGLGRADEAEAALAELDAAIPAFGLPSVSMTSARLHGSLAVLRGDLASAEHSFTAARQLARNLSLPFHFALLERDDGRRLRRAGDRQNAIARLRRAHGHLTALGARPYVTACERELQNCGAEVRSEPRPAWNLTASELAVARLVCTGRSNREVAGELYVSVKAVEFHLGHVFDKIGIRSRKELASRMAATGPGTAASAGGEPYRSAS
jgi:DNA-binding CsgD family transcriptional regulator